jgi:hypothetical protein
MTIALALFILRWTMPYMAAISSVPSIWVILGRWLKGLISRKEMSERLLECGTFSQVMQANLKLYMQALILAHYSDRLTVV